MVRPSFSFFFFFNDTATTEIYTLSLHDALPISLQIHRPRPAPLIWLPSPVSRRANFPKSLSSFSAGIPIPSSVTVTSISSRSEEHTSELQSHSDLVCRLLLEKKKKNTIQTSPST